MTEKQRMLAGIVAILVIGFLIGRFVPGTGFSFKKLEAANGTGTNGGTTTGNGGTTTGTV